MKIAANIAGVLLGLLFLLASVGFFLMAFHVVPPPDPSKMPPAGSPADLFMKAMMPTGYLMAVKVLEFIGAILVMIPRVRNFGLLILGPILINILFFHIFLAKGGYFDPMIIMIVLLEAFLLWCGRKAFAGLLN